MSDTNYLDMSDEEVMNMSYPLEESTTEKPVDSSEEVLQESDVSVSTDVDNSTEELTEATVETTKEVTDTDVTEQTATSNVDGQSSKPESQPLDTEAAIDYKAAYEKVLAPFKANGRQIKVDSIEDAVQLMQMGANYSKRMQELKPHMRTIKMLESADINEDQLNLLIEVAKGKPEAIKKIVADTQLDTYSLDSENDAKYTPADYRVNDSELELDSVIQELQSSPVFNRTAEIVSKEWDAQSKAAIASTPVILKTINQHVESGFYDQVMAEVDKRAMLGRIPQGLPMVEVYGRVAQEMSMQVQQQQPNTGSNMNVNVQQTNQQANTQQVQDTRRLAQKKAIAPTKTTVSTKPSGDFLNMSDEEFERYAKDGLFKVV